MEVRGERGRAAQLQDVRRRVCVASMYSVDTIVAPATPAGEAALAVVRVSGPQAADIAATCHSGVPAPPRYAWHGDYRSVAGAIIDDVVFCFYQHPKSYTGEDLLEISSHGNPFIVSKIVDDLTARGCRLAEPGEFTKRAFLNGRLDLTEAEAVMDLIRARTDRALSAAQRQLRGALRQRVDETVGQLLDLCAAVEAHVDFPEEDLPLSDRRRWRATAAGLAAALRALAATRREGDFIRDGVKVVLVGEPNVGKSSLLNRLVGYERAIVSEDPGTTRDFLEERITLGGWCMRIFDTAGLREAAGAVERAGVTRTLERMADADVLVLVMDGSGPPPVFSEEMAARLAKANVLGVLNKCDRPHYQRQVPIWLARPAVEISALTGEGLTAFQKELIACVESLTGDRGDGEALVVNARHEVSLREAAMALDRAADLLSHDPAIDVVAVEVRCAIDSLEGIVGKIDHESVLDRLFASFCIGK